MRYIEIVEAVELSALVGKVNRSIYNAVEQFVKDLVKEFTSKATRERRVKLGYHPYDNNAKGYKPFNSDDWEKANQNWGIESDGIGDNLSDWLPTNLEDLPSHKVYALMSVIGTALTKDVQEFVKTRFGDPVRLHSGELERQVKDIYVTVWWRPKDNDRYAGAYYYDSRHANGNRTLIYIVVNRNQWAEWLRDDVGSYISGEGVDYERYGQNIINTFIHEYEHLEQDIKGANGNLGLIPYSKKRRDTVNKKRHTNINWQTEYQRFLGRVMEIDSHATAAAAETVNKIINNQARYGARWNKNWSADDVSVDDWNGAINHAIGSTSYFDIPNTEYQKYIIGLNRQYNDDIDPAIKTKFLTKVKQRFIKTYVNRLRSYLKTEPNKPVRGPGSKLPESKSE